VPRGVEDDDVRFSAYIKSNRKTKPTTGSRPPSDIEALDTFLLDAAMDAAARAGDSFDRTPLTNIFADAECDLIEKLRNLVTHDAEARAFVRRWQRLVEVAPPDEYPQRRGATFAKTDDATWTIGAQRLRAAVTLFDALVRDELVKTYRILGTVTED
jgi:hypothetical protein